MADHSSPVSLYNIKQHQDTFPRRKAHRLSLLWFAQAPPFHVGLLPLHRRLQAVDAPASKWARLKTALMASKSYNKLYVFMIFMGSGGKTATRQKGR